MRRFTACVLTALLGAAPFLCVAPAARAQTPASPAEIAQLGDVFVGTLEIDVPAGGSAVKRYFAKDHTYRDTGTEGDNTGTWRLDGDRVCTQQTDPPVLAPPYCNMGLHRKLGERWTVSDPVTTNTVIFTLAPGRKGAP